MKSTLVPGMSAPAGCGAIASTSATAASIRGAAWVAEIGIILDFCRRPLWDMSRGKLVSGGSLLVLNRPNRAQCWSARDRVALRSPRGAKRRDTGRMTPHGGLQDFH